MFDTARRRFARAILVLTAAALVHAPTASAQLFPILPDSAFPRGERVRVVARPNDFGASPYRVQGRIDSVSTDGLRLHVTRPDGSALAFPVNHVQQVEVLRRPARRLNENITIFSVLGLLAGSTLYAKWCSANGEACRRDFEYDPEDPERSRGSTLVFSVLGGALLGGALGYAVTPKRWDPVLIPVRGAGGQGYGVRLGATVRVTAR